MRPAECVGWLNVVSLCQERTLIRRRNTWVRPEKEGRPSTAHVQQTSTRSLCAAKEVILGPDDDKDSSPSLLHLSSKRLPRKREPQRRHKPLTNSSWWFMLILIQSVSHDRPLLPGVYGRSSCLPSSSLRRRPSPDGFTMTSWMRSVTCQSIRIRVAGGLGGSILG